jgi:hypothetical protein
MSARTPRLRVRKQRSPAHGARPTPDRHANEVEPVTSAAVHAETRTHEEVAAVGELSGTTGRPESGDRRDGNGSTHGSVRRMVIDQLQGPGLGSSLALSRWSG